MSSISTAEQVKLAEKVARLQEAVQRLVEEAKRLQRNLERAHKLQTSLTAITQQFTDRQQPTDTGQ